MEKYCEDAFNNSPITRACQNISREDIEINKKNCQLDIKVCGCTDVYQRYHTVDGPTLGQRPVSRRNLAGDRISRWSAGG